MSGSTASITVFTRHSANCPKKQDRNWRRCNCRKSLYIYEDGKVATVSAKTRSWEQAEKVAQAERDLRDPVQIELSKLGTKPDLDEAAKETLSALIQTALTQSHRLACPTRKTSRQLPLTSQSCGHIYRVTNKIDGKVYVGQTGGSVVKRWRAHTRLADNGQGAEFHAALRMHGEQTFVWEVVATTTTLSELTDLENFWISKLQANDPEHGYNITGGL